jgi:hypothetical protein
LLLSRIEWAQKQNIYPQADEMAPPLDGATRAYAVKWRSKMAVDRIAACHTGPGFSLLD